MKAEKLNLDTLLMNLPGGIREKVRDKITKAQLRDDYNAATSNAEIIYSSIALAQFEKSPEVLEKVYIKLMKKYPNAPELSNAYLYFFNEKDKKLSISNQVIYAYISTLDDMRAYEMWTQCFIKLRKKRARAKKKMNFLKPLLDKKPIYRNYSRLYLNLAEAAFQCKNHEIEDKAREFEDICSKLPTIEKTLQNKGK
jgi:predicted GNAT family acetyltransferase